MSGSQPPRLGYDVGILDQPEAINIDDYQRPGRDLGRLYFILERIGKRKAKATRGAPFYGYENWADASREDDV